MDDELFEEVRAHDARVARTGLAIWIGAEPTFTHPRSNHPCWLTEASGGEKEAHARSLLAALAPKLRGSPRILRVLGRTYPGETEPRFCFAALFARHAPSRGRAPDLTQLDSGELAPTPVPSEAEAWLTVTPDPAVVEVNMAPAHDLATFYQWACEIYRAAEEAGLSPIRLRYNGELTDSGGGGQLTLGGPTPALSPFFVRPQLLPGLVRYWNRHPALSYLFAPACCGSASQGPRADEGVRERFDELPIALDYLGARGEAATPAELWGMLGPLLVDASGCTHRAEINVEKLWNPWFGARGQLGLVELRALRMPATPERMLALAALFRALAARLAEQPFREPVVDWGSRLHDVAALPWYLERDLAAVLGDLDEHGFGLGPRLRAALTEPEAPLATVQLDDATLELRSAISFWPLLGDSSSQEQRGARLVDSSAARLQLSVHAPAGNAFGRVSAQGFRVPLRSVPGGDARAIGSLIYRAFVPRLGLHPAIGASDPLTICWERGGRCARLQLYGWKPGGGAYDGVPSDQFEAACRRAERIVVTSCPKHEFRARAAGSGTLDLRRVQA